MTFANGGPVTGPVTTPIFIGPDGYVLSARVVRELGADPGLLAKLNRRDRHRA